MWTAAAIGIAWALITANLCILWGVLRRMRKAAEAEEVAWLAYAALTDIAVQSYLTGHRGTFQAWSETMGDIQVQVRTRPKDAVLGED